MTKPKLHRVFLLVWLACFTVRAAETEEAKLIAVLRSAQPAAAKDAACRRLKHIGTSAAVPALAPLLLDEALSHSARYALESIPGPEVDAALRDALGKAKGAARIGIVDSLGDRGDLQAAPALISLLTDPQMGEPAARALGKIGGPDAAKALQAALPKDSGPLRNAVLDALLRCADGLRARDAKAARSVYGALHGHTTPEHVRLAAFRGAALASDDLAAGAVRLLEAKERAPQLAGLQLVREIEGEDATKAFATALAKVDPTMQIPLLHALRQRGDRAAGSAVGSLATKGADPIRIVALRALAVLGDASTVPLLAERAAAAKGAEQDAARLALARLRGEGVGKAILAALAKADPRAQGELATALGRRRESEAVPALLKMAGGADSASRLAAARSLALLADESTAPKLIPLLVSAKTDAERAAFERALASTCGGMGDPQGLVAPAIAAMNGASVPARGALLRVLARVGGDAADGALRTSVKDGNAAIRDAAVRAMAEFGDSGLAPDLLALAKQAPTPALGVLALRGYWRLVGEADAGARLALCEAGLAASARPEEKKLGLTALATVSHPKALALAESLAKDPAVRAEAEAACVEIAASLVGSHPSEARAALTGLKANAKNARARTEAAKALDAMERYVGYISTWQVAGPYRQKGKECQQLFDIAFDPEKADAKVAWKPAPRPNDASLAWKVDLSSVVGGTHCVVYVRSRVHAPAKQTVRLDMGADDGIKVWIGGKLVHANNAIRALTPEQDRASAVLEQGWNDVLVKITQHTQGCEACIRIRKPDGAVVDGLRFGTGE